MYPGCWKKVVAALARSRTAWPRGQEVRGDLRVAADAIRLSRRTLGTIKGQPVLGLHLERRRAPAGSCRTAQPDARRSRHGVLLGVRGLPKSSLRLRSFRAINVTPELAQTPPRVSRPEPVNA